MTAQSNSDHVDLLHVDWVAPGVKRLTMADPRRRNALSEAMMAALATALDAAASDPAVRVVVLAATGPVFCAGHDLKEMTAARQEPDAGRARFAQLLQRCSALMRSIMANPKPVIAAAKLHNALYHDNSVISNGRPHIGHGQPTECRHEKSRPETHYPR